MCVCVYPGIPPLPPLALLLPRGPERPGIDAGRDLLRGSTSLGSFSASPLRPPPLRQHRVYLPTVVCPHSPRRCRCQGRISLTDRLRQMAPRASAVFYRWDSTIYSPLVRDVTWAEPFMSIFFPPLSSPAASADPLFTQRRRQRHFLHIKAL